MDPNINQALQGLTALRGLFITAMPDCLLYYSWMRDGESWSGEDAAAYFGDLIRANGQGLKALGAWTAEMQVTIETNEALLILRELESGFVVAFVFERATPLGMVRLHVKRVLGLLEEQLPRIEPEQRPRAVRVAEFLLRYAPDSNTALQRAALRSGLPLSKLEIAEELSATEAELFERSVCDILGLEGLNI